MTGKRIFDVLTAILLGVAVLPVILVTALVVRTKLGAPVLFRQTRPGLGGKPFEIVKFRTMNDIADTNGHPLPDAERLTPLGGRLRRWSLDELPELWNVVRGDMSLVGPRPLLMDYLDLYSDEQARRHEVRPGLTGVAQVDGRNDTTWEARLSLDIWYIDNCSIWLDIKVLFLTIGRVVGGAGVNAEGKATMSRFRGAGNE